MIYRTLLFTLLTASMLFAAETLYRFSGTVTSGADSLSAAQVHIFLAGDSLHLRTDASGKYDGTLTITAIRSTRPPKQFQLMGNNYPNPFNPSTTIPVYGDGYLKITNILGQTVAAKNINSNLEIKASGLASGIYFARYVSKNYPAQNAIKKMLLLDGGKVTFYIRFKKPINPAGFEKRQSLSKSAASDSARFIISLDGYSAIDTMIRVAEGANINDFYLHPVLKDYFLSGTVTSDGNPVKGALVVANIDTLVDSVYTDVDGKWVTKTYESYDDTEEALVHIFKDKYQDWASGVFSVSPGETVVNAELIKNFTLLSGEVFNQRGKRLQAGDVRILYNGNEEIGSIVNGNWSVEVPLDVANVQLLVDNPDYTNRFLAVQKPGQTPAEHNIGQASLKGKIGEAIQDTAKISLSLDKNILENLQVYAVADSAMNDTVKKIIDGTGQGMLRWVNPYTVEILTKDIDSKEAVPQDRTNARIAIVEDYQKALVLDNGRLLIGVNYIVNADYSQGGGTPNWVHMYRNNNSGPGHGEETFPERSTALMYARNQVNSSCNLNNMGAEFHGNHFRTDPDGMGLGGYVLDANGFLNTKGKDMLFIYLFDDGSRFRQ